MTCSALYVVDLVKFRETAAGDNLRVFYENLSKDPNSLSNLDQASITLKIAALTPTMFQVFIFTMVFFILQFLLSYLRCVGLGLRICRSELVSGSLRLALLALRPTCNKSLGLVAASDPSTIELEVGRRR